MKVIILLSLLVTVAISLFQYFRDKNLKKLLISILTFGVIITLAMLATLYKQAIALYMVHFILILYAWGGLLYYLLRDRYYWWIIFSPVLSLGLFFLSDVLAR